MAGEQATSHFLDERHNLYCGWVLGLALCRWSRSATTPAERMPLLNYTTTVPVNRTIGGIQGLLVEAGARQIMTSYSDVGQAVGVAFAIETSLGLRHFHLPVNAGRVEAVLKKQRVEKRRSALVCRPDPHLP